MVDSNAIDSIKQHQTQGYEKISRVNSTLSSHLVDSENKFKSLVGKLEMKKKLLIEMKRDLEHISKTLAKIKSI